MSRYTKRNLARLPLGRVAQDYVSDLRIRNLSAATVRIYERNIRFLKDHIAHGQQGVEVLMAHVTPEACRAYIAHRTKQKNDGELAEGTVHQEIRTLKTFGRWLAANGYDDPLSAIRTPKSAQTLIEVLTIEEIGQLFGAHNPAVHIGARWQAMLAFFLSTGVRLNELINLKLGDVDFERHRAKVQGKGDKERFVIFGARATRMLSRYVTLYRPENTSPFVFLTLSGEKFTAQGMHNIIDRIRKKTGIKRVHFHLFRHTFATQFLIQGGDSLTLKNLLGHTTLDMTDRYAHLARELSLSGLPESRRYPDPLDALPLEAGTRATQGLRRGKVHQPRAQ